MPRAGKANEKNSFFLQRNGNITDRVEKTCSDFSSAVGGCVEGLRIEGVCFQGIGPVNLRVGPGECVGLYGPSGVGKTLFLRAIADLDPHGGKVYLNGTESAEITGNAWRKRVGLLPAESGWWFDTVAAHFHSPAPADLRALGLGPEVMDGSVSRLSTGERQRLAILRLLENRPLVLLLDEPTSSLDPENVLRVEKFFESYRMENRTTVIWVSHDREQIQRVATRRFLLTRTGLLET